MAKQPQIGDVIEAWCEKCRLNLDVSVAAVVGDDIKQVQCRTCGNFVAYKPPVPDSVRKERVFKRVLAMRDRKTQRRGPTMADGSSAPRRRGAARGSGARGGGAAGRTGMAPVAPPSPAAMAASTPPPKPVDPAKKKRWRELTDQVDSRSALPYTPQRSFEEGDYLLHKGHGMGYVEKVTDDEIVVLFRTGEETLPINQDRDVE